jgi:nitrate reductase / nitrite oxidoreductase, alpha subunit
MKRNDALPWIKDERDPSLRDWEQFYRNRWQHDKIVRSTHGVNCTGGCTWQIFVKDGIVTWEMQGLDYPSLEAGLPPYEPRGCQRGISYSWYLYSPLRVKYPYVRGVLLDLWKAARSVYEDPVEAWKSIVENPEARASWQRARGKGGFRRIGWDSIVELIAAANIYTIRKYGPDRIAGFSPIPAMSMISYAGGARMLQLMGGVSMSFYDWYCDRPPASPETWGEQTDVAESADWYNAKLLAVMGSNLAMTRTPDVHFAAEARHNGSKMWVFSPDFSQVSKYADEWVAINAGQDGAWWMAVNHVLLKEFHHEKQRLTFSITRRSLRTHLTSSKSFRKMASGRPGSFSVPTGSRLIQTSRTATGSSSCGTSSRALRRCRWGVPDSAGESRKGNGTFCCAMAWTAAIFNRS